MHPRSRRCAPGDGTGTPPSTSEPIAERAVNLTPARRRGARSR